MNKYDFGEQIVDGSTMDWARRYIKNRSYILELGPSVGTLTKYLKEEKDCKVDIVEMDSAAGEIAQKYSNICCLGNVEGNLEENIWYEKIADKRYDSIVILDVLEHLRNPKEVLEKVTSLLKDEGKMILSIPNIAHNSVIINLINNKFEYTPLGLLDNTHVHFFTYQSARRMIEECGLNIIENSSIQLRVGENEITNNYLDIDKSIEKKLRIREMADVYQFLFIVVKKKNNEKSAKFLPANLDYTLYKLETYIDGRFLKNYFVNPLDVDIEVMVEGDLGKELRIDPLEVNCLLKNITITGIYRNGETKDLEIKRTNGIVIEDELLLFLDNDSQIYIKIVKDIESIRFKASAIAFDDVLLERFGRMWIENASLKELVNNNEANLQEYEQQNKIFDEKMKVSLIEREKLKSDIEIQENKLKEQEEIIKKQNRENYSLNQENDSLNQENDSLNQENDALNRELAIIKKSKWYQIQSILKNNLFVKRGEK